MEISKFDKGLFRDTRPHEQPPGTYPYAKNGVRILGINQNEPGFVLSAAVIPYTPIGIIETDRLPIILSTNNIYSAIGFFDSDTDAYIPIFNDATASYKLGFNTSFPINGQSQRNYKSELITAFTDFSTFPKFLNCDVPVTTTLDDWRLFPRATIPDLSVSVIDGGILPPGAYYILEKFIKNDGTETTYLATSDVIIIAGQTGTNTGKALEIHSTRIDPDYNLVQIGIISKISGVISSFSLEPVTIGTGNQVSIIYTGANITTDVLLEELLLEPVNYSKAKSVGQLNDALYLTNLEREPEIHLQKHMLLARVEWVSQLITVLPKDTDHSSGKKRSFMHREVYNFFIRLSKTRGAGWTPLFHIPGPVSISADLLQSTEATTGNLTAKVFQVEDTIRTFDPITKTGTCGVWVNDAETYPDTVDYDASDIGGQNLRGQPVRHHRMPSLRWCKQNLYPSDAAYGKSKLDLLGIRVSNIIIPGIYADQLDGGYEIYYAKRTIGNSTVLGQSILLHAARNGSGAGATTISGPDLDYKTTGGNWNAQIDWAGSSHEKPLVVDRKLFRFHAFDLLLNQPAISPRYMCQELKIRRMNMPMIEDFTLTGGRQDAPIVYLADYVQDGSPPVISEATKLLRKIADTPSDKSQYAPANLATGKWFNVQAETAFVGKLEGPELLTPAEISYSDLWTGVISEPPDKAAQFEVGYLSNLMNLQPNLYLPFNGQSTVRVAPRQIAPSVAMFGGDVFLCDYTFHTYGWTEQNNATYSRDASRDPFMGIKAVRRIACEAASNIYNRFETTGNIYSKWYPNSPLIKDDITNYITAFDRRIDPNQFGYNKDSNALNDIITATIFNPLQEDLYLFHFRVHRGGKLNRQLKKRSWRTFLPLDYYELQKNMGEPQHIEGMDDRLLIHCLNALFITQDKLNLEQGTLAVTIGSGDIFQFEPQEAYSDKLGYAGTHQNLACVRTPAGYIFPDTGQGQLFLFKSQLKLLNQGLDNFFTDNLRMKENNPFIGNGITIGYDPFYKRILVTIKNLITPTGVKPLQKTQAFIDTLTPGASLVTDKGVLMRFLGVNSTEFACSDLVPVIIGNIVFDILETTPVGTLVYTITPISGESLSYYVLSGNLDNAISLEAASGNILIASQAAIDYELRHQLVIQAKAVSTNGLSANFSITINILPVDEPPISGDQEFTIPENIGNGVTVGTIPATDPEGQTLSFSILDGNSTGVFAINSSGVLTIASNATIDAETTPVYLLIVGISDGTNFISVQVTVNVTNIDEPPPLNDATITIYDTTLTGTEVYQFVTEDPEGQTVTYELVNASVPGVFLLDTTTGKITLVDNAMLNPLTTPQYTLTVRAIDTNQNSDTGTLTINVLYDLEQISFRPASPSCSGGCPIGYSPTPDNLYCERFTRIAATPPTGGVPIAVAAARDSAYSNFGMIVYQPGYNINGTGTINQWLQQPIWKNSAGNIIDGALNRSGVWGVTSVPNLEPIGFSIPLVLTVTTTVIIAVAGDNKCKIAIDGATVIDQNPTAIGSNLGAQLPVFAGQGIALAFKFWHGYPFTLEAGTHYIGIEGVNFGGPGGFGAEIYKNTIPDLAAAVLDPAYIASPDTFPLPQNYYTNLDLLFSTRSARGGTFSSGISGGYSCPISYAMDGSVSPPECVLVERVAATTRTWTATQVYSIRLGVVVATLPNATGQTWQGIPVPYYPPVSDDIDCGGALTVYYNTPKAVSIQKNDCVGLLGSIVKYAVPGGIYLSTISQATADGLAQTDVDTNKQAYANSNGYCIQP